MYLIADSGWLWFIRGGWPDFFQWNIRKPGGSFWPVGFGSVLLERLVRIIPLFSCASLPGLRPFCDSTKVFPPKLEGLFSPILGRGRSRIFWRWKGCRNRTTYSWKRASWHIAFGGCDHKASFFLILQRVWVFLFWGWTTPCQKYRTKQDKPIQTWQIAPRQWSVNNPESGIPGKIGFLRAHKVGGAMAG